MSIAEPLGMYDLIVNTIAGNEIVFTFMATIFISTLAAKFHMPKIVFLIMIALFGIIFSAYIGGLYLILILLSGFAIFSALGKVFT